MISQKPNYAIPGGGCAVSFSAQPHHNWCCMLRTSHASALDILEFDQVSAVPTKGTFPAAGYSTFRASALPVPQYVVRDRSDRRLPATQ